MEFKTTTKYFNIHRSSFAGFLTTSNQIFLFLFLKIISEIIVSEGNVFGWFSANGVMVRSPAKRLLLLDLQ